MLIDESRLSRIAPQANERARTFVPALNEAMARHGIDRPLRVAAFLAQVLHESVYLRRTVESLDYSAAGLARVWPKRYRAADGLPNLLAIELAGQPESIANHTYAKRNGNGPVESGDGWRYRGRGLLQVTGRANYQAVAAGLDLPLLECPELLAEPPAACLSATWWWRTHKLNALADAEAIDEIGSLINTGRKGRVPIGAQERRQLWLRARAVLLEG
ncbi:lytic enzyme [Pseudomonas knackmussii B13]|uniref:Lytic enzyme n=1 Tax=Pseudomonas knackmussii (strain DSM 6978 / CCUG 54928 / LMG 23759 / B13) TaxID=1301098 RepID=A0A024HDI6_PSEKB|nr:glycoside hydrolase family 19 protein [Pseudomonas knackmussii]CDF83090.1 lytic enzyme [Pseudomonas knackmussii B13]